MTSRRLGLAAAFGLSLFGCRPNPELAELPGVDDAPAAAPSLSVQDYAAAMDPGPQPMLTEGVPPWMFSTIGLSPSPTDSPRMLLRRSKEAREEFEAKLEAGIADNVSMVMAIRSIACAVVLAEQAAAAGERDAETLAQLERAYAAIDVPLLAGDRNAFGQFVTLFAQAAAADGADLTDARQLQDLAALVQGAVRAAGPLHRHTVAELVRRAPDDDAVPTALLAAANARRGTSDSWPLPVAKLAIETRGEGASGPEQLDLARVCFAALDLACGDAALAKASAAKGYEGVVESGALAKRIVELDGATGVEERVERARAHLELGRHEAAKEDFETLRKESPKDARPVAGLAKLAIETELDFIGASRMIDAAGELENGDEDYYEISIGTRATAAMADTVPRAISGDRAATGRTLEPLLQRMQSDAKAYAALGNEDGRFLVLVFDVAATLLEQYVATGAPSLGDVKGLTGRIMELQSQIPKHAHAYRLLMTASLFERDRSKAVAAVGVVAPGGPQSDVLALRHARALCDLALTWSDGPLAEQCMQEVERMPRSLPQMQLHADSLLTVVQLTGKVSWLVVGKAYEALLEDNMTPGDARALNNVAMALWEMGNRETALNAWRLSAQVADDYGGVPQLNLVLAKAELEGTKPEAAVRGFTGESREPGVKLVALAWLEAWAKGKKAKKAAGDALRAAIEDASNSAMRPTPPDPHSGLLLQGTLQASFSYTARQGLDIRLDASGLPWAVFAPENRT